MNHPLLFLRAEYNEYVQDCKELGIKPWSFRDWQDITYYYDAQDALEY